jgi:hypothetical protein
VYLPPEIGAGTCYLILCGTGNQVRATTNFLTLQINDNKLIEDAQSTVITQSLYEQLVDMVKAAGTSPITVRLVSEMTDHSKLYLFMGTASGYTKGHMYYWNGSAWADLGEYHPTPDSALSTTSTNSVQNKVVTAAINSLQNSVSSIQTEITAMKNNVATLNEVKEYIET